MHRPQIFFEQWNDPLISGIRWVEELLEIAGGECSFPELRQRQSAKDRIINPADVMARDPEIIIASWRGRPVKKGIIRKRDGWQEISACCCDHLYEVKSTFILQLGPAALIEGVHQLHAIIAHTVNQPADPILLPQGRSDAPL